MVTCPFGISRPLVPVVTGPSLEHSEYSEKDLTIAAVVSLRSLPKRGGPDENTSGPMWRSAEGQNKLIFTFKRLHMRRRSDHSSSFILSSLF
jgi:hypothetical protein